jgi:uncharacterized protein YndB with AHSA1/START domain
MAKNKLVVTLPSDKEILLTRVINAPRELVFQAYTDPKAIPQFWGPRKYTTVVDKMDVRPGGKWRFIQKDDKGEEFAFNGEYREVKAPEKLVHTFEFEPWAGHISVEHVTFEDLGGKTKIVDLATFDSKEDRDGMIQSGMESGASELWDRFEEMVQKMEKEASRG